MADSVQYPKWKDISTINNMASIDDISSATGQDADLWDTNGDGKISKKEFDAGIGEMKKFDKLDKNGDHQITEDDFTGTDAQKQKKLEQYTKKFDKDNDHAVSREEFTKGTLTKKMPTFKELDQNSDKSVTAEELQKRFGDLDYTSWDTNGDGKIDKKEYGAAANAVKAFEKLDKNSDGKLTQDEVSAGKWKKITLMNSDANAEISENEYLKASIKKPIPTFKELDADKDNKLTADDLKARFGERDYTIWDTNGDGKIDKSEYSVAAKAVKKFETLDINADGKLTEAEMGKQWKKVSLMNKDADTAISEEEYLKASIKKPIPKFKDLDADNSKDVTAAELTARFGSLDYTKWDINKDGKINSNEYAKGAGAVKKFEQLDINSDGVLTADEAGNAWKNISSLATDGKVSGAAYVGQVLDKAAAAAAKAGAAGTTTATKGNGVMTDAEWKAWMDAHYGNGES